MKVLLTGHLGYIGTVLAPMLLAAGHEVVGLDSDLFEGCSFEATSFKIPQIRKDIRDIESEDLQGFDSVIHLAALSNDPLGNLDPHLTYEINHAASFRLAQLSRKVGVRRFLFSSSCSTYGAAGERILTEEATFNPVTPYGQSKVSVEFDVSKLADPDFSPTYLRNTTAYGVSPKLRFDLVLNNLVAHAYATKRIFLKSDGTPWRPLVHVEDISRAFVAVLHAPRALIHNQALNVGITSENYQIRDLAEIVGTVVPGSRIEYANDAAPDKRSYRVDFGKISRMIPEFKPEWNVRRGAEQLYEAYRKANVKLEDFEGPRYTRITHIKQLQASGRLNSALRWIEERR